MTFILRTISFALPVLFLVPAFAQQKPFTIPSANLAEQIIWGSACEGSNGLVLGFGGQDQKSDELPRTRIKVDGQWKSLSDELRKANPLQEHHESCTKVVKGERELRGHAAFLFFQGLPIDEAQRRFQTEVVPTARRWADERAKLEKKLEESVDQQKGYGKQQLVKALARFTAPLYLKPDVEPDLLSVSPKYLQHLAAMQVDLDKVAESFDAEPPARYLSHLPFIHNFDTPARSFFQAARDLRQR